MIKTIHRISKMLATLEISARQFDRSIGTANGYFLRMRKNNASVGSDVLERIAKTYPQINLTWLITGDGTMFKKDSKPSQPTADIDSYVKYELKQGIDITKLNLLQEIKDEIKKNSDSAPKE